MYHQVNVNFSLSGYLEQQKDFMYVFLCFFKLMWSEKRTEGKQVSFDKSVFPAENPGEQREIHTYSLGPPPGSLISFIKRFPAGKWCPSPSISALQEVKTRLNYLSHHLHKRQTIWPLKTQGKGGVQLMEWLLGMGEALGSICSHIDPGTVVHTCNPSTQEMQARGPEVQGHP